MRRPRIGRVMASRLLLAAAVFGYFAITEERFFTTNNVFTIFEGFSFLGLPALAVGVTIWRRYQQGDFTAGGLSAQRFETDPEITAILHELDSWAVPTVLGAGSWDIG